MKKEKCPGWQSTPSTGSYCSSKIAGGFICVKDKRKLAGGIGKKNPVAI